MQLVEESGSRIDRGRLLKLGVGAAGGSLGLALLTPLASLGPVFDMESLDAAPWARGRRLVDADDRPLRAAAIEPGAFYTAFPEGANKEDLGAAIVLVRLAASDLRLPAANAHYDAERHRRVLEDLHPRRLRDRALPDAALPRRRPEAGPRLPVPLLDVRPGRGRRRAVRPGRAQAADAAARDRRARRAARGRQLRRAGGAVVVGCAPAGAAAVIRRLVRLLDERTASTPFVRRALRYVFPDHWSFLLGEVALYAFAVLVATGTYLAFFFDDSTADVVYRGPYAPLRGQHMTEAYRSVLDISTILPAQRLL